MIIYTHLVNVLGKGHNPHKGHLVAGLRCQFLEDVSKDPAKGSRTWTVQVFAANGQKKRRYRTKPRGKCKSSTCLIKQHTTKKDEQL